MTKAFKISLLLTGSFLLLQAAPCSAVRKDSTGVRFIPMKCERLPDMNIPRAGHQLFVADGELVAVGGHTEGFVRTATAEYFKDGTWHTVKTHYPHDYGFSLRLPDGDYLIGGGCSEDFGVGQSFGVERYDPSEHSFTSFPVLDVKRTLCSAALLPSGEILVSGNWYADDALGLSDGKYPFESVQGISQNRASPFIFPFGKDDAVVFGTLDWHGEKALPVIDRLHGQPFTSELLNEWVPWTDYLQMARPEQMKVTDPVTGEASYLFWGTNQEGQIAILRFCEGEFSKVDTDYDIPTEGPWGAIQWYTAFYSDSKRGTALMAGADESRRIYLLSVDYRPLFNGGLAAIQVYFSSPVRDLCSGARAVLPDGRFVVAGGLPHDSHLTGNYNPSAAVFAFSPFEDDAVTADGSRALWLWVLGLLGLLLEAVVIWRHRRGGRPAVNEIDKEPQPQAPGEKEMLLYRQLCETMEKEELYKRQGLSLADVASRMRTNTKYISSCISAGAGCSFVEFVNGYRIRKAKELLLSHPGMRINEISEAVGYANESSFYRNFKNVEGCTPQQWQEKKAV